MKTRAEVVAELDAIHQEPMLRIQRQCQVAGRALSNARHEQLYALELLIGPVVLSKLAKGLEDVREALSEIEYAAREAGEFATRLARAEEERDRANASAYAARAMLSRLEELSREGIRYDLPGSIRRFLTGAGELTP